MKFQIACWAMTSSILILVGYSSPTALTFVENEVHLPISPPTPQMLASSSAHKSLAGFFLGVYSGH